MTSLTTGVADHVPAPTGPSSSAPPGPDRRRRLAAWLIGLTVVTVLVTVVVVLFTGAAGHARADDPLATVPSGNAALAQLLTDEGVAITSTSDVADAVRRSTTNATLVVANADLLEPEAAGQLARAPHARLILLRPTTLGLNAFGVAATTVSGGDQLEARCTDPAASRATTVSMTDREAYYARSGSPPSPDDVACFPTGDGGFGYLRAAGSAGPVDLVAGGTSNAVLDDAGNAAFAMNVFGSRSELVWLVAQRSDTAAGPQRPTLLPRWWGLALIQAVLAVAVVAVWRGRRLGPIMVEPLPVRVRASETVEGHGRLYDKIGARDRAADALRSGVRRRLGRAFGHSEDPVALAAAVAQRTGRPDREVTDLLAGPAPPTDEALVALAVALDQLETDARRT